MSDITNIYLVRHGVVHNPDEVIYGRMPGFYLSEEGRAQALAAAERLRDIPLDAVFTSPLVRALETAAIILQYHPGVPLYIEPRIIEIRTPFEGRPMEVLRVRNWDAYTDVAPGYEQPRDILARMRDFLDEICEGYAGKHVAAVSHGDVIAFTNLWVKGVSLTPENKEKPEHYPHTASINMLTYRTTGDGEKPAYRYIKPY